MKKLDFVGWGAMNYCRSYVVDKIVEEGEQLVTNSIKQPGGSAANTIYGLSKLGFKTGFIGAVGSDENGKILINDLINVNVDTRGIRIKTNQQTGECFLISNKSGKRSIYIESGANKKLLAGDIELPYLEASDFLHMSSFVDEHQFSLQVKIVQKIAFKPKISFSPGMIYATKGLNQLKPILQKTQVLFINKEEIEILAKQKYDQAARMFIKEGCRIVVVPFSKPLKRGNFLIASYVNDGGNEFYIKSIKEKNAADLYSSGTADAFATGFLYGLVTNKEIYECAQLGDIVAKFAAGDVSARNGLPTLATLSSEYVKLANLN